MKTTVMKTIVITGATSGIRLETARILCREGFQAPGVGRSGANCAHAQGNFFPTIRTQRRRADRP